MPRGFVDDPEGNVADEEVNDGGFGDDILAADVDGIDILLMNVGHNHPPDVTDDHILVIGKEIAHLHIRLSRGVDIKVRINICRSEYQK